MKGNFISDIIKNTTEVNLRYSATLLNLSKDYIKSFNEALTSKGSYQNEESDKSSTDSSDTKQIPLIVAGHKGERANASFAVNNTSQMDGTVTLQYLIDYSLGAHGFDLSIDLGNNLCQG